MNVEKWFGRHQHKMSFVRTVFAALAGVSGLLILIKVFGK